MKIPFEPWISHPIPGRAGTDYFKRRRPWLALALFVCLVVAHAFPAKVAGANLIVTVPTSAAENRGTLTNAGTIQLFGALPTNLVVSLQSSDTNLATVPATVTIVAGQIGAAFSITVIDDLVVDGIQTNTVTGSAPGFTPGSDTILILDNESPPVPANPAPANFAVQVSANSDLAWVSGAAGVTNDVYFGTNAVPGVSEFLGTTVGTNWMLPLLAPNTTYYWQIVARTMGTTVGPVWRFTTRGVDHFEFNPVPSPQVANQPFPVTLTARDELNRRVTNFNGSATLAASGGLAQSLLFRDDFEDGTFNDWTINAGNYVRAVTNSAAAGGTRSFTLIGGTQSHFNGISHGFSNLQPAEIQFHVRAAANTFACGYFVAGNGIALEQTAVFFYMGETGFMGLHDGVNAHNVPYVGGQWYKITLLFDWPGRRLDFYVDDSLVAANVPFRGNANSLSTLHLYNHHTTQAWWDEIQFLSGEAPAPVAISPTNSGGFTDGVWSGNITVLQPGTNIFLTATNGQGAAGVSSTFDVRLSNDLKVTVGDQAEVVAAGSLMTNRFTVDHSGPDAALGVTLTNFLPSSVNFVSAVSSQGGCVLNSNRVECTLGNLPAGAMATVQVVTIPTAAGSLTNRVDLGRTGLDGYDANNTAQSVVLVLVPLLSIADIEVVEGSNGLTAAVFNVDLWPPSGTNVTVAFATLNGSAVAGSDFLATNGILTFLPNQTNQSVTVWVIGDTVGEPHESFSLIFSDAVNASLASTQAVAFIENEDPAPDVYLTSFAGPPFGSGGNEFALDWVFNGNWRGLKFETVVPGELFSSATRFIFMEGSDGGANEMAAFLATNRLAMENWVNAGGRLFLNAAPGEGGDMDLGFGVTLTNNVFSSQAVAWNVAHPIFWEPFSPVGISWLGGSFGHAVVGGAGMTPVIVDPDPSRTLLGERRQGQGLVLFGGMTPPDFHFPQPDTYFLRANILSYAATFVECSNCPPVMLGHPTNLTIVSGEAAVFIAAAKGTEPLFYQWRHDGTNIPGATNAAYAIPNVQTNHAGTYYVFVTNAFGTVTSSNAVLDVLELPPSAEFQIAQLLTTRSAVMEHNGVTGDDRGGIAASTNRVFYTGDSSTARFSLANLSGGVALGQVFDALVSDLRTETVYSLANGATPLNNGGGVVTTLLEHDGNSGMLNGVSIPLSSPINVGGGVGIFAGYGRIVLHTGDRVYDIHVPSGIVVDKGPMGFLNHQQTENWAYWGVAEYASGTISLVYVRDQATIVRTAVPSGVTTTLRTFSNLSDMAAITVSIPQGRWYFHHEGSSQFGGSGETIGYADAVFFTCTNCAPVITTHPENRVSVAGSTVGFSVVAMGTGPMFYQWRHEGTNIPGATNMSYSISNIETNQAGNYSVSITNAFGGVISSNAVLNLLEAPPSADFRIAQLLTTRSVVVDHNSVTGDDRGGIAVSTNRVFYTGDNSTARFSLFNLSGGTALGQVFDALVSDLRSGKVYSLANGATPLNGPGTMTTLLEHDANTGLLNGVSIPLSIPIILGGGSGIFAGYGRIVLHTGSRVYDINLPTGIVIDRGPMEFLNHQGTENWAYWGVAEAVSGALSLVYVRDSATIVRTAVPSGLTTILRSFSNLSDMAAITVSVPLGRWYFHHEGSSQFGGTGETIGYADAVFNVAGSTNPPFIYDHPVNRTVALGRSATFTAAAIGGSPLDFQWRKGGTPLPGATNSSLTISNVQAADAGLYSVRVTNLYGSAVSSNAMLTVVTNGAGRVAVFGSPGLDQWNLDVRDKLDETGLFSSVDSFLIRSGFPVPTMDTLMQYSAVLVYADGGFNDPVSLGNELADFVDAGGVVVFATFAFQNLAGRIATPDYMPVSFAGQSGGVPLTLIPDLPSHPLLAGVNAFRGGPSSYHHLLNLTPGSTLVAHWNNGVPLVATKTRGIGNVVALNFFPPSSDMRSDFWDATSDGALLMANALRWGSQLTGSNAPVIWSQPSDRNTVQGDTATFSVSAFGTGTLGYQWFQNGTNILNATNASHTIANAQSNHIGSYYVVVTNIYGATTSSVAVLTLVAASSVVAVFDHPAYVDTTSPGAAAESDNIQASIQLTGFLPVPFTNLLTAVQLYDQILIPDQELRALAQDLTAQTRAALSNFVFEGGKLIVHSTATAPSNSVGLLNSVFALSIAESTSTGPFLRRAGAVGTAFADDPFSLPANNTTLAIVPSSLPPGSLNIYSNATGSPVIMMNRGSGSIIYLGWDWNDAVPRGIQNGGWMTVLESALLQGQAPRPPLVITQPVGLSAPVGTNVTLSVLAGGTAPLRYQWRLDGANVPNATNATYIITNLAAAQQGNYSVLVTNIAGMAVSSNAFLNVLSPPVVTFQPSPQTVVQGGTAIFSVTVSGSLPMSFRWLRNGVLWLADGGPTLVITNAQSNGVFRVAISNSVGSVNSLSAALTVLPDADRDGIPDSWELLYFGNATNGIATADVDADGMSNAAEFLAGTDPTNALSLLRITISDTNTAILNFVAQTNRGYTVQYRTNLQTANWNSLTNIAASPTVRTISVTAPNPPPESIRFYRIVTPPMP